MTDPSAKLRLDKWLWHARFFKTRSLSAKVVGKGHCRVNGQPVSKPAHAVAPGDVLTFPQLRAVRLVRVVALGERRGPATEAQALYVDLDPPVASAPEPRAPRYDGGGRPTKKDRRMLQRSRPDALD